MISNWRKLFGTTSDPMPNPDADIARDFAKVETDINEALRLNDALDKTGKKYRDLYDRECRVNAHLRAENAAQAREIEALRPDAEKHRRSRQNLRQFRVGEPADTEVMA